MIDLGKQEIQEERQQLEQTKVAIEKQHNDLKAREPKLKEAESFLPSVRQLQAMNVDFTLIMQYVMIINERSVISNTDLKTSAYDIGQIIRGVREIDTLNTAAEMAKKQVASIDVLAENKTQALTTIMNLKMAGFSEKDIAELATLVQSWNQSDIAQLGTQDFNNGHVMSRKLDTKLLGV